MTITYHDLLNQLRQYTPADADEVDCVARTVNLLERQGDRAFSRQLLEGHITASALLLGYGGEKALLMHHRFIDKWMQFGGHCDGNPDVRDTALRETVEESGIPAEKIVFLSPEIFDVDVHVMKARPDKNEPEHFHYDIRYLLYTPETEFVLADEGVVGMAWLNGNEAAARVTASQDKLRMIEKWQDLLQGGILQRRIVALNIAA